MERYLSKKVNIIIDRQLGSNHPTHNFIYTLNYGYIPNTVSGDNEEFDVYIIGEFEPLETYVGYVVAVVKRENDVEDKLVVCKDLYKYDKAQIEALIKFQERFFKSYIIMN